MTRIITIKWTQRNVDRMHRWLGIRSDFSGFFTGRYTGYKACPSVDKIIFIFEDKEVIK